MEELTIFTTYDSFEADQIIATLQDADIPAYKRETGAGQYMKIVYGMNSTQAIDIVIPASAEDAAVDILADMGLIEVEE